MFIVNIMHRCCLTHFSVLIMTKRMWQQVQNKLRPKFVN